MLFKDSLFLGFIKDKYKYIARDENGDLYAYTIEPKNMKNEVFGLVLIQQGCINLILIFQWLNIYR